MPTLDAGSGASSSHGEYSTTGFEDHTGQVGLQYTYNNSWAPTAQPLTNGSALLFATRTDAVLPAPVGLVETSIAMDNGTFRI